MNAAAQQRDPNSVFNWLRRLVEMRKTCPEIGWGENTLPRAGPSSVLVQRYAIEDKAVLVLHNLGPDECTTVLNELPTGHKLIDLFGIESICRKAPRPARSNSTALGTDGFESTLADIAPDAISK